MVLHHTPTPLSSLRGQKATTTIQKESAMEWANDFAFFFTKH